MKVVPAKLINFYARCMQIENTLADAIEFFHLDIHSSAGPWKIEVNLQLTLMASRARTRNSEARTISRSWHEAEPK